MATETVLVAIVVLIVLLLLILLFLLFGRRRFAAPSEASLFENINRRLDQLEQLSKGVEDLSRLFLVPHTRGGIGESLLEELLKNWLPRRAYAFQHTFKSGARVDAVVKIRPYLVPIDAKFPLESVRRSMNEPAVGKGVPTEIRHVFLKHVEDIAEKYIHPDEGTMQFALMYIPSERVYYQVFVDTDGSLNEEALRRGVIPVGPSSLFLYLQTVAYGLRGLSLPEERRELVQLVQQLREELLLFAKSYTLAGTHLKNLQRAFDESYPRLSRVESVVDRLQDRDPD